VIDHYVGECSNTNIDTVLLAGPLHKRWGGGQGGCAGAGGGWVASFRR